MANSFSTSPDLTSAERKLLDRLILVARIVLRHLGPGHPESAYHLALVQALQRGKFRFRSKPELHLRYHGQVVATYVPDFIVWQGEAAVIVECKAAEDFAQADFDQVRNYLSLYHGRAVGLLLGFGGKRLAFRRVTMARKRQMMTREEVG